MTTIVYLIEDIISKGYYTGEGTSFRGYAFSKKYTSSSLADDACFILAEAGFHVTIIRIHTRIPY